jgi:sugar lactone lactonase YvrE
MPSNGRGAPVLMAFLDQSCFACMLGGPDGKTLFMMAATWRPENPTGEPRTGQVLTAQAPAPGVGWL